MNKISRWLRTLPWLLIPLVLVGVANAQQISPAPGSTTANALKSATTTVTVSAATAPTAGQVLTATSGTVANWQLGGTPGLVGHTVNLTGSAAGNTVTATFAADEVIVETASGGVVTAGATATKLANYTCSFDGSTTGAGGMDTGSVQASGGLYIYAIYNGTTTSCVGTIQVGNGNGAYVYPGSNMPSGYTQSALIWAGYTITSKIPAFIQTGNRVTLSGTNGLGLTSVTGVATPTALNLSPFYGVKTVSGYLTQPQATGTAQQLGVYSNSAGTVGATLGTNYTTTGVTGNTSYLNFTDVVLYRTSFSNFGIYWQSGNTTASSVTLVINGYTF